MRARAVPPDELDRIVSGSVQSMRKALGETDAEFKSRLLAKMQEWDLGSNHVEYWKTFERPWHITVGFPWFATWTASRRLRWPIGRPGASPLPWIATSGQCRHELTEETQNVHRIRHGYEEVHEKDTKRARWIPGIRYRRGAVSTALMLSRVTLTSGNPPRGWAPSGEQIK